jgi:phenylacetate-coenzyme A ligase PaaK-like adenylate-forming protein
LTNEKDALLKQMYESARVAERLDPVAFDRYFGRQRAMLVQHAATTCPFYADRLNSLHSLDDGRIDPASWLDVPILTRLDLRDNFDAIKSTAPPERHGDVTLGRTSGTTGMPVEILRTAMQRLMNLAVVSRFYAWHGLDPRRNFVLISGDVMGSYPNGEREDGDWMPTFLRGGACGDTIRLRHPLEPEKQIEFLSRQPDCYLTTQPSNALALATALHEMGANAPKLEIGAVFTIGELVRDSHRVAVREAFGCEILDVYSGSETGTLACQCAKGRLHVNADSMHLEILRADGTTADPGEIGRIIVTPFTAWASPLIRYDTGDLGRLGPSCGCGATLPVLELAVGRDRNMFRFSDGSTMLGFVGLEKFRAFFPALQWQVAQTGPETLEIRYVSRQPEAAHDHRRVEQEVSDYFGRRLSIDFVRLDAMPHGRTGKLPEAIREFQ